MANEEHVKRLRQGAEVWKGWRDENPEITPDLSKAELRRTDLIKTDLSNAILTGSDLSGAILIGANLSNANLSNADLNNADLSNAILSNTDLSNAILTDADFSGLNLSEADLSELNLSRADLRTDLSRANLSRADLRDANFMKANLSNANLSNANLSGAVLIGANLTNANLNNTILTYADLSHVNLNRAVLIGADLHNVILTNANLSDANVSRVDLTKADLTGTNLTRINLSETNLSGVDLRGLNLTKANLTRANLSAALVLKSTFTGATLTGACIADWQINNSTKLEHITCDYIFRAFGKGKFSRRLPINSNKVFSPGEFALWASVRASALETIDLTFVEGLDWQDFFSSLQEVRQQNPDTRIFLQGVEERNGQYVVRLRIETDKTGDDRTILEAKIETTTKELVETKRQLHEAHGEIKALDRSLEKALRMATNQGPKYNFQGAQFAGGFAEIVQGDQNGGIINNYGSNADDIVRLLSSLGKLSQAFPDAQQQQVQVHLEDLATDLKQPEKCSSVRLTTRIANLFGVLILLGGGIATATDFANNVLELSEKLNVPTQEFQPQLQQFKQIYPDFDWQS